MREPSALLGAPFFMRDLVSGRDGVTLRLLDVAPAASRPPAILDCLSIEEQARAARFRSVEDRLRFALTRAALRNMLGEATGEAPEALVFETGRYGKPSLAGTAGPYFNVSHSGSFALIGVSRLRPIGVDIEWNREISDMLGLAEAFFSRREYRSLVGLNPKERESAFYAIWTGKESVLKALGTGIGESVKDFSVASSGAGFSLAPETESFARRLAGVDLEKITVPSNYAAAFALA